MPKSEVKHSVYDTLRHSITNLLYKPGQELDINALAEQLGVSRSPVRDALLKLSGDKLVDIFPQKGTRVSLLNKEIIRQERFMRVSLELGVIEPCMKSLTDDTKREIFVTKLKALLLAQHACLLDGDKVNFIKSDDEMHHLLYTQANCEWVWETQLAPTGHDHRIRILSYSAKKIPHLVETEHEQFIQAISENNAVKILEIEKAHLSRLYGEIPELEKEFPEYFEK